MYHAHFDLKEEPFGVSPDCRFFYQTEQHREALATLYYAIQQRRGFALLVGRPGLGKTSILVHLIQLLDGKAATAFLPQPYFDGSTVLDSILLSLGLSPGPSQAKNHRAFYEYLMKLRLAGNTCVVVFDEAQGLDCHTLEAIRMLSNFETPTEKLVQIVLAGQPQITEMLRRPECEQLRQRLNAIARLEPLSTREVRDYILHRLRTAGGSPQLFTLDALEAIATASGGVLRNVNTICFNALSIAYALSHRCVGSTHVAEALEDLDLSPPRTSVTLSSTPGNPPQAQGKARKVIYQDGPAAQIVVPAWSVRIWLPARSLRLALIAASLVLVMVGTMCLRSLLLASR